MEYSYGYYFPTEKDSDGVFMHFKKYIRTFCSNTTEGNCKNILNGHYENLESNYWKSDNNIQAYYEITLERGYIYTTNGVLFSCYAYDCIYDFTIYGIEKGDDKYKEVCTYKGETNDFKEQKGVFPCNSKQPLTSIKLMQRGLNLNKNYQIAIYHLDFYGYFSLGLQTIKDNQIIHLQFTLISIVIFFTL